MARSATSKRGLVSRRLFFALMVTAGLSVGQPARADLSKRVAIGAFHGPQASRIRDVVEAALLRSYLLIPDAEVEEAARRSGVTLVSDADFEAVGRTLNVDVFVTATVRRQRNWRVHMVVRRGDTGRPVGRYDWSHRRFEALA